MVQKLYTEEKIRAIADAIRSKSGTDETYTVGDMPTAIESIETGGGGGTDLPEEAFLITGDCGYRFANGGWDWFLEEFGDKLTIENVSNAGYMFSNSEITELPFELNFIDGGCACNYMFQDCFNIETIPSIDYKQTSYKDCAGVFYGCENLKQIGTLKNLYPSGMTYFFHRCNNLRNLPTFENPNFDRLHSYAYAQIGYMFQHCYSLRSVPENILRELYVPSTTNSNQVPIKLFNNNYALDEIVGITPLTGNLSTNAFAYSFEDMHRLKNIIFTTQEDETPYSVNWKNQTFDLTKYCGYVSMGYNDATTYGKITGYNSGITADKEVTDDASYHALKNDPDWFTLNSAYSRYNHDSAVNTINSLPDTSAYGTNTIKFHGASGSLTDGGAINTLTEEEIAVATAKGWTVTFA